MRRATHFLLIAILIGTPGVLGCSQQQSSPKTVAIATLMSHPALDQVIVGLKERLAERGWQEGRNLRLIERNANQQIQVVATIAEDLVAQNPDVIVAITTPVAQAVKKVAQGRPLVFGAVTDPIGAGLITSLGHGNGLVTGTSDAWPYRDQLALIRQILPQCRRLGVLYNPGEAASQYGIQQIRRYAPQFGFTIVEASVNTVGEVRPVAESLAGRVDALFLSSDNTVIGGMVGALKVALSERKPLFVGDSGTVEKGGLAAVSVGYRSLGWETGDLIDRMLRGQRDLKPVIARGSEVHVNRKAAELMGVTLPPAVLKRAFKVYDRIAG